ncbi:MAG TPA: hypothetical protein VFU73_08360 [Actinocrinis sp.]|nr:hypothetical protein [Actinocrinis sp.]
MDSGWDALATGVVFVWLGMVLAISFLEAPLKFRAPGVTPVIGLGIGRLVFRALNAVETVFALVVALALGAAISEDAVGSAAVTGCAIAVAALAGELAVVRPRLKRRSDLVLTGHTGTRSRAHYAYVAFEIVKVLGLVIGGAALLGG